MAIFETYAICIYRINLQLTGSGWSLVSMVEWSGGQVVRAVEMFMMAKSSNKGPSIYYVIQIWGPERPPPIVIL